MRIIFFDIDCLRPDHLGCYGYDRPTSPTIDSVAKEGTIFDHYYCSSSPCLPSRTAWSSGRFGINNGVVSNLTAGAEFNILNRLYIGPEPKNEMFMRQLRQYGYDTISFSNFADRHNAWHFMVGWSEYHTPNLKGGLETAEEVNRSLLQWLKYNATRENYFLHINYWDAHRPYKMKESWMDRFKDFPVQQPWPDEKAIAEHQQHVKGFFTATGQFKDGKSPYPLMPGSISSREDFEHMITGYDASIAYVDYHISQVLDELKRQDVFEDAVIIISGDHGDAFGEHGIYSDHVCADECIHHISCIIRAPGVSATGAKCGSLLYNVDFAPTICDMLGIPVPELWDGSSFLNNLKGKEGLERDHLVWDHALYTVQRAVRTKTHLMVRTYDPWEYQFEPMELYNIEDDPYQTNNVADKGPQIVGKCDSLMNDWLTERLNKENMICDPLHKVIEERKRITANHPELLIKILNRIERKKKENQ